MRARVRVRSRLRVEVESCGVRDGQQRQAHLPTSAAAELSLDDAPQPRSRRGSRQLVDELHLGLHGHNIEHL